LHAGTVYQALHGALTMTPNIPLKPSVTELARRSPLKKSGLKLI